MATKRTLKEKLDQHNADESAAIKATQAKYSGLRAAELLKANAADLLAIGVTNIAEHPDMKRALGAPSKPDPATDAKGRG